VEAPSPHVEPSRRRAAFYPLPAPAEPVETFGRALDRVSEIRRSEEPAGSDLRDRLGRAIDRRTRTVGKLREWLEGAADVHSLRSLADLVMIHHREIPEKASEAVLVDPATNAPVTVRLRPELTAIENAQRLYQRAKRLRRGIPHVASRLARIEDELNRLRSGLTSLDEGETIDARTLALLSEKPASKRNEAPTRREERVDGFAIWVGRNAAENDRLLRCASPDDVWMHVRGVPGSHVIVRRGGARDIPRAVLQHAARLAAERSKARGERRVEVAMTPVKHVRKPKGAPPGLVIVEREDTLTVDV